MMNGFENISKRALSLVLCVIIVLNYSVLCVYASGNDEKETGADPIVVVSMGDSYSSGEGVIDDEETSYFYCESKDISEKIKEPDWLAHRSMKAWPGELEFGGKKLNNYKVDVGLDGKIDYKEGKDVYWFFVASSGAVTDDINGIDDPNDKNDGKGQMKEYSRDGYKGKQELAPQIDILKSEVCKTNTVDYVTLTIGGNDMHFSDIIKTAVKDNLKHRANSFITYIIEATNDRALSVVYMNENGLEDQISDAIEELDKEGGTKETIRETYSNIYEATGGNAKIIVAGYPTLIAEDDFLGFPFFTKKKATVINNAVKIFNGELKNIVDDCYKDGMKIYFAPVIGEEVGNDGFDGHEAYAKDSYINGIMLFPREQDLTSEFISEYSIHPNLDGAEAYARCVQKKINEIEKTETEQEKKEDDSTTSDTKKKIDDEIEKRRDEMLDWLQKKCEDWINQWVNKNCNC